MGWWWEGGEAFFMLSVKCRIGAIGCILAE